MGIEERKERERLSRRKSILQASFEVYGAEGYLGTTMDKIAERAELSRATLYLHFKTKDEIFVHAIASHLEHFSELLEDLYSRRISVGEHLLDELWKVFKKYHDENPEAFSVAFYYYQREMIQNISENLRELLYYAGSKSVRLMQQIADYGVKQGLFEKCNPKTLAEVIWTSFLGIILLENSKVFISHKNHMEVTRDLALDVLKQGLLSRTEKR